ncbi:hypothetical protein N566_15550 [Streptomycetaceae bacterium MP113-05]|nr:hypothetical protein N566_15550 [Streptomycetaceae bacterium MP113-05]
MTFQHVTLLSPHRPPQAYPGRPLPPELTDSGVLRGLDAENINALFGAALNTNRDRVLEADPDGEGAVTMPHRQDR